MALISAWEVIDVIVMTLAVGYIFKDTFARRHDDEYDPVAYHKKKVSSDLWEACLITAPAVVFHEVAHKVVALGAGLEATFHASYEGLGLGVLLKMFGSPFVFFVPGYVAIFGGTPMTSAFTALAGPLTNGLLFLVAHGVLKYQKSMRLQVHHRWLLTKKINGFLFVFNMIPIPGFDGFTFFRSLLTIFIG